MSTIDIWLDSERLTKIQAARSLCGTGTPPARIRNAHGDEITIYPAHYAYGAIQPPTLNCASHGGNAEEARRYAALITFAAEVLELADEFAAEIDEDEDAA